jgi:hypothetical protein
LATGESNSLSADTGLSISSRPTLIIQGLSNATPQSLAVQALYASSTTNWFINLRVYALANTSATTFTVYYYTPV